jgi:hypothetical protein
MTGAPVGVQEQASQPPLTRRLPGTMSKRAAWLGPWHPVHRQDVGACELPIGTSALSE